MAKISEQFGNGYLRAEDFDGKGKTFVIDTVATEDVGDESKLVAYFQGEEKGLPLNKTNALAIASLHGDDTDEWGGKSIKVYRDSTMYQGRRVACMRVAGR